MKFIKRLVIFIIIIAIVGVSYFAINRLYFIQGSNERAEFRR